MSEYNSVEKEKSKRPCSGVKHDLIECLMNCDCVQIDKRSAKECVISGDIPNECHSLRLLYFECKRSLLDNRQRFRGRKGY